ncbi:MAG TPA: hypothetical protein VF974_03735 [Patescibacteria group bacterium]
MSTNEKTGLTQREMEVATTLLTLSQVTETRQQFVSEIDRLVNDEAVLDKISAASNVRPTELTDAARYFRTLEAGTKFDEKHRRAMNAFIQTPQLRNFWNSFIARARQVETDPRVISEIARKYGRTDNEVRGEIQQITNYQPETASAGTQR